MTDYVKQSYGSMPYTTYPYRLAKYLTERFDLQGSLLDVGCGRGEYLQGFWAQGLDAEGVDLYPEMARKLCAQVYGPVDIAAKDITKPSPLITRWDIERDWDNGVQRYDTIFMKSVIEHLSFPDRVLWEALMALKTGGRIVILTPNWRACYRTFYGDCTHKSPFTTEAIAQLLELAGFKEVTSEIFYCLPLYWDYPALRPFIRFAGRFVPHWWGPERKIIFARPITILATGVK